MKMDKREVEGGGVTAGIDGAFRTMFREGSGLRVIGLQAKLLERVATLPGDPTLIRATSHGIDYAHLAADRESWLTKRELAYQLRCSIRTIERLQLPAMRVGGQNRYKLSEVEDFLAHRSRPAGQEDTPLSIDVTSVLRFST